MLLLIFFGGHCYGEIAKRQLGLGYRIGYVYDQSSFNGGGQEYISYSPEVNYIDGVRIPFFLQLGGTLGPFNFDEDILYNFISFGWFFDYRQDAVSNMPPALADTSYSEIISKNSSSGDISIQSSQTFIPIFSEKFPQYSTIINSLSEPSLSADFNISTVAIGRSFGFFIPSSGLFADDEVRLLSVSIGGGVSLTSGHYKVNLCDPYVISGNEISQKYSSSFRRGSCFNKTNLYSQDISHIGFASYFSLKGYTYFTRKVELNFVEIEQYQVKPFQINTPDNNVIKPKFRNLYANLLSVIYRF